jgi:putative endonuclease
MQAKADNTTTLRGREAEQLAAEYLADRGLQIIECNFRVRGGEIDLVCRDGQALVFVEVRLRSRSDFGGAGASITRRKQQRIVLAARHYLARRKFTGDCRFDCILLEELRQSNVEWIKDAFSADT